MYLPLSDCFGTKWNSVCFQIIRKMVNTIYKTSVNLRRINKKSIYQHTICLTEMNEWIYIHYTHSSLYRPRWIYADIFIYWNIDTCKYNHYNTITNNANIHLKYSHTSSPSTICSVTLIFRADFSNNFVVATNFAIKWTWQNQRICHVDTPIKTQLINSRPCSLRTVKLISKSCQIKPNLNYNYKSPISVAPKRS